MEKLCIYDTDVVLARSAYDLKSLAPDLKHRKWEHHNELRAKHEDSRLPGNLTKAPKNPNQSYQTTIAPGAKVRTAADSPQQTPKCLMS